MRERTTWNKNEIAQRTAAIEKKADPYAMNQDHLKQQPPADKYLTGDPSSFAEDIHPNDWSSEYSGGQVKRNEIGMPEMRSETFNHAEKTAAVDENLLVKKADLCTKVARLMAKGKRFASKEAAEQWVEDQAVPLMNLPDQDLIHTFQRLAEDQQAPMMAGDQQQAQAGQQQQQAQQQQAPMAAQEQQAADEQMKQLAEQAVQAIQSGDQEQAKQVVQAMVKQAHTILTRRANDQQGMPQQAQGQQQAPVQAQGQPQGQQAGQQQQAPVQAQGQPQGQQAQQQAPVQAQGQSVDDQVAQMVQQAIQGQSCGPKMANAPQAPVAAPVATPAPAAAAPAPVPQGTSVQANDDALLDQMLMGPSAGPAVSEADIQLDPAPMDVGEVSLGPEDDVLRTLFANQEAQDAEEAQQAQQGGDQQKQAHAVRTAATRTVGTRPTAGVARIGGAGAPPAKGGEEVNRLAGLWQSAPDVRDAFGLR